MAPSASSDKISSCGAPPPSSTPADQHNNAKTTTKNDERMGSANTNTKQSAMHGPWPSQLITQDVCWLIISTQTDTKLSHRTSGTLPSCPLSPEYISALLCTHQWRLQHQATRSHHVGHLHPHQHRQIKTTMPRQQRNMTNAWAQPIRIQNSLHCMAHGHLS